MLIDPFLMCIPLIGCNKLYSVSLNFSQTVSWPFFFFWWTLTNILGLQSNTGLFFSPDFFVQLQFRFPSKRIHCGVSFDRVWSKFLLLQFGCKPGGWHAWIILNAIEPCILFHCITFQIVFRVPQSETVIKHGQKEICGLQKKKKNPFCKTMSFGI